MVSLKTLIRSYESWVASHPDTVGDLETTTKWMSYFIAGRISDSNVVSELIYSLSNMLVLYNDRIIVKAYGPPEGESCPSVSSECYRLKVMLTTLEYCEVFIEISAKRVFGKRGKWVLIALVQLVKAAGRFFLLKNSTTQIITSPALQALNRRQVVKKHKEGVDGVAITTAAPDSNINCSFEQSTYSLKLKRSGRIVRKVEGAPPIQYRDFKLSSIETHLKQSCSSNLPALPNQLLQAEYLYIAKPLIHLAAMGVFGQKRWKQYAVALTLDLLSIRLYYKHRHLMTQQQRLEMSRRCVQMLLYLLRSPFYERFTKSRLERILNFMANNVPLVKLIAGPIREYIPHWQDTYFYMWSS